MQASNTPLAPTHFTPERPRPWLLPTNERTRWSTIIQQDYFCSLVRCLSSTAYPEALHQPSWDFLRAAQQCLSRSFLPTPTSISHFSFCACHTSTSVWRCFCLILISYPSQASLPMNLLPIGFSWHLLPGELDWKPPTMIFHIPILPLFFSIYLLLFNRLSCTYLSCSLFFSSVLRI